jgi:CRP-like cAMP-binding protein
LAILRIQQIVTSKALSGLAAASEIERPTRIASGHPVHNVLLQQITNQEFDIIAPHLQFMKFENATRLEREGKPIESVYFLNGGMGSMIIETADGRSVEVGVAGHEDMIGLPLAGGLDEFTYSVIVQVPGDGFRVAAGAMKQLLPQMPELSRLLLRRLAIRSVEVAQNAACNRLHNVRQRLSRWLLLTHDRLDSDVIKITHDFLSRMVGTDRPTVTLALADFEREGLVKPGRATIIIKDRAKLAQQSCECYALFRRFNTELGLRS